MVLKRVVSLSKKVYLLLASTIIVIACGGDSQSLSIDREQLVNRHNISFESIDSTEIPQMGNGEIAFGIDVTGLQTFYGNTLSQWGWHTSPLPAGKTEEDFQMEVIEVHGHTATYPVVKDGQEAIYNWLRENPHRLNLGKLSFLLDGNMINPEDISQINQRLDLWKGTIYSNYKLKGLPVKVITICHPETDALAVSVESPLISENRLSVQIDFPYGHPKNLSGGDWSALDQHKTQLRSEETQAIFSRRLDQDSYEVKLNWEPDGKLEQSKKHQYALLPSGDRNTFSFTCQFSPVQIQEAPSSFEQNLAAVQNHWAQFWQNGGAIDLSESTDPRWEELERRIVLSQYLLAVNEAGSLPPQESGLLLNSNWYGKFHLEMHWWHGAHYQLWDRWPLFDRSLSWYPKILPVAQEIAQRQGYEGARWPKMIGPDGRFGPSKIGPWLLWQQPHPIFYAEQNYRVDSSRATLEKWQDVVFETADFMASFAYLNEESGNYDLGPWIMNAAENNHATKHETTNPAFELAYWRYGLTIACKWRERMGLPPKEKWLNVIEKLAPLPVEDGVYVMYENVPEMWTRFNKSHVDIIGTGAFIPSEFVDLDILDRSIEKALNEWDLESTWGWDFPWLAMASARAGQPEKAINALLMKSRKNNYSKCGINTGGPAAAYFPGNGGLLYAVAMMAAGWDNGPDKLAPGFPDDGSWVVRYEGLKKAQ